MNTTNPSDAPLSSPRAKAPQFTQQWVSCGPAETRTKPLRAKTNTMRLSVEVEETSHVSPTSPLTPLPNRYLREG